MAVAAGIRVALSVLRTVPGFDRYSMSFSPMSFSRYIKLLADPSDEADTADSAGIEDLFAAMFDGGVSDLELGAIVVALHGRPPSVAHVAAAYRAAAARVQHLRAPESPFRPLVFASYNSTRRTANLLPWLALVLRRLGVPVLVHGNLGGACGGTSAYLFRELGVMPSATATAIQTALEKDGLAFVPAGVLCPGLANLIALQTRLGLKDWVYKLAVLIDPFRGNGMRVIGIAEQQLREIIEAVCYEERLDAVVFEGADDDAFVEPFRRPAIVAYVEGSRSVLFEPESNTLEWRVDLPEPRDVAATAEWTRRAVAGEVPLPHPLVNQLACCLFASGYAADMNQAKAIATMESGVLMAGEGRVRHTKGVQANRDA
ncbi:MAG: DNA-binding protein YbiB [Betaproteobacteria bacterium]|nr:MAG: DNA-binding protein YbiB [Betaproteobacteria bacterium]